MISTTRKGLVDTLIKALKSAGIWTKLDRLWLFAAENSLAALIDLVALQAATVVNSLPFTTDQGFGSGSNTTAYIDSNFTPSAGGTNYTLNAACHGARSLTAIAGQNSAQKLIGATVSAVNSLRPWSALTSGGSKLNDGTYGTFTNATSLGLFVVNRSASNARQVYLGGSSIGSDAVTSTALNTGHITFAGDPVVPQFSTLIVASGVIGGSLTSTDQANFYSAEHTYMQAIGLGASAP